MKDKDSYIGFRYILLSGSFWSTFCVGAGFLSLFLAGRGMSASRIGIVTATFSLLAVIIQPLLGNLSDRYAAFNWRNMIVFIAVPLMLCSAVLIPVKGELAGGLIMGFVLTLSHAIQPFINSANYYYTSKGKKINFGVARAVGSGCFALVSYLVGALSDSYGSEVLPLMTLVFVALLALNAMTMPWLGSGRGEGTGKLLNAEEVDDKADIREKDASFNNPSSSSGVLAFLRKYPGFSLMLVAVFFMYFSHNTVATYLIQVIEYLGGGSDELGKALALQAAVEIPVLFAIIPLKNKLGVDRLMMVAGFGYLIKALMYAASFSISFIYISQLGQMISFAVLAGTSVYYTAKYIRAEDQFTGQAYMTSMMAAGAVAGSLCGGWLIDFVGIRAMLVFNVFIAAVAAVMTLVSHDKRLVSLLSRNK